MQRSLYAASVAADVFELGLKLWLKRVFYSSGHIRSRTSVSIGHMPGIHNAACNQGAGDSKSDLFEQQLLQVPAVRLLHFHLSIPDGVAALGWRTYAAPKYLSISSMSLTTPRHGGRTEVTLTLMD